MRKFAITSALLLAAGICFSQQKAISVEKLGQGQPVLFLPGFTSPGSLWLETIKSLDSPVESHLVSYAGFNGLPAVEMPWYDKIKNELFAYIKTEKLTNLKIVGHSMGGNLAVELAAEFPDRIDRVVIVDALPCMRELMMPGVSADQIQYDNPYSRQMLEMPEEAFRQSALMMASNMTSDSAKVHLLLKWSLEADRKIYVNGYTDLLKLDLRPLLARINAPTLILGASFPNKEVVLANFQKQYANLSTKTIEIADDCRHFIMFDQPEWFYDKLNSFLSAQ